MDNFNPLTTLNARVTDLNLPLMEEYYTIQGEGFNTGMAAHFVRLGGCDVGCVWCDVKASWDASLHPIKTIEELVELSLEHQAKTVVVTGGEPLMYNLEALCRQFQRSGIQTMVETSGAYPVSGFWNWICVSPKKFKAPLKETLLVANELKVVVFHKSDFKWGEEHAAAVGKTCQLYLQPEWSKMPEMLPLIIDYVKKNPQWKISLQTHKYMNIP